MIQFKEESFKRS